jgi:hypothetical protein
VAKPLRDMRKRWGSLELRQDGASWGLSLLDPTTFDFPDMVARNFHGGATGGLVLRIEHGDRLSVLRIDHGIVGVYDGVNTVPTPTPAAREWLRLCGNSPNDVGPDGTTLFVWILGELRKGPIDLGSVYIASEGEFSLNGRLLVGDAARGRLQERQEFLDGLEAAARVNTKERA